MLYWGVGQLQETNWQIGQQQMPLRIRSTTNDKLTNMTTSNSRKQMRQHQRTDRQIGQHHMSDNLHVV